MKKKTVAIKIEKGVPLTKQKGESKYPLAKLEVGDSFVVPINKRAGVANAVYKFKLMHSDMDFCTRKVDGVCRVWRTK